MVVIGLDCVLSRSRATGRNTNEAAASIPAGASTRAWAARMVSAVLNDQRSLDAALADLPLSLADNDRALVAAITYGVLRDRRVLEAMLAPRLSRAPQPLLNALLLVGLYQLETMRIPPHAAVHATVSATAELRLAKARGMVNAILRGHQRDGARAASEQPDVAYSHPRWLVDAIRRDWPDDWQAVLAANNAQAPMHLRVNARASARDLYLEALSEHDHTAGAMPFVEQGVTVETPMTASALPGFQAGVVSIQDGAAQLAAGLVGACEGERVLDACAAPGNKSAHLLETADIELLALEIDPARQTTLEQTLSRLGLVGGQAIVGDAAKPDDWWDGRPFDRILLDAPCSGSGVIRRHPDIKWLRRESDIAAAASRQGQLLDALWATLAERGRLVYATCSILRAEGSDVIASFLARTPEARERPIQAEWGEPAVHGRRIAPGQHGFDGFYYAILERVAD